MSVTSVAVPSENAHVAVVAAPPLRVSFSWTLLGNVIYSACNWGMVSVLAKLGSTAVVGQFALGLAIVSPVFMFTNLQLRAIQATDSRSEFEFADYFTLRCLGAAMGLAAVVGITFLSHFQRSTTIVVLLVAVAKAVESLSDMVAGLLQKIERLDQLAISLIIKGFSSLIAFAVVFWRVRSLAAAVLSMGFTWLLVFILYEVRLTRTGYANESPLFRFNRSVLKELVGLSLPLGFVMALGSLYTNIPRYVLQHYLGSSKLGIFASLAYLGTSSTLVINALGQSASARLSRMFADRQSDAFTGLMRKFALFGVLIGVVGVPMGFFLGRPVLSLIYQPEYANHLGAFLVIIATTSIMAVASFLGCGVTAARCFKMQTVVMAASTLATAMLSVVLIPRFGLLGAAFALFVAALVQMAGLALLMRFELRAAQDSNEHSTPGVIALFSPSLAGGGAERVLLNLACGLHALGHEIDIVLAQAGGEYLPQVPNYAKLVDLGAGRTLTSLPALTRYIRRRRPAGIIAFQDHANVVALWARTLAGTHTPVIATVHNTWSRLLEGATYKTRALATLIRRAYTKADAVVAVSEGAANDLSDHLGLPRTSIQVIYNPVLMPELFRKAAEPVDHSWFAPGASPVIIGVGRLTKQKDFPNLVRAFSYARRQLQSRLVILGEGEERNEIEHVVHDLDLENEVWLPGFVENPYKYLRRSAVFVLSSVWEGLPTVLIEALALGVPVISTDCESGPREILKHGALGALVPVGNIPILGTQIIECLLKAHKSGAADMAPDYEPLVAAGKYARLLLEN
jgi:glycosyltransferase involved in cell wall biosynthesis/O-antigen/teichoic acid export membrane protein